MGGTMRVGLGRYLLPVPRWLWRRAARGTADSVRRAVSRLGEGDRRVREAAVRALAAGGGPSTPVALAATLGLPLEQVEAALATLERKLMYLVRDASGAVEWAFPFTAASTPHRVTFDDGTVVRAA